MSDNGQIWSYMRTLSLYRFIMPLILFWITQTMSVPYLSRCPFFVSLHPFLIIIASFFDCHCILFLLSLRPFLIVIASFFDCHCEERSNLFWIVRIMSLLSIWVKQFIRLLSRQVPRNDNGFLIDCFVFRLLAMTDYGK